MSISGAYWLLSFAILVEVCATTALKSSQGFTRLLPSMITVVGYAMSFWSLAQVIRVIPTGITYAIWSGVGIVLISLLGWIVHGERLDGPALLGIGLILAGVVVLNVFSESVPH